MKILNHPSSFWFASEGLLLSVYVDDLLLSGPSSKHDGLWQRLRSGAKSVAMDDPESLDRFLGRTHREVMLNGTPSMAFDMQDYALQAVRLYSESVRLRRSKFCYCFIKFEFRRLALHCMEAILLLSDLKLNN